MLQENQYIPRCTTEIPTGPWLVFAPHPDDETFGIGGALLLAARQGIDITLVVLTDGALGGSQQNLVAVRETETRKAASRLGIHTVEFWRQRDRALEITDVLIQRVVVLVESIKPKSVFFTSPLEPHPDHRNAAALVWEGLKRCQKFSGTAYAYEVAVQCPANRLIDISSVINEKLAVISTYESQLTQNRYSELMEALNRVRTYSLPYEVTHAEALFAYSSLAGQLREQVIISLAPYWQNTALPEKKPLVSVVVRTKNRPKLLREALHSIAIQSYSNIEVVVVNDGGLDIASQLSIFDHEALPKLRHIDLKPGLGRSGAANMGLQHATGEYLIFLDDDDWYLPNHIANLVEALAKHSGAGVAYAGVECIQQNEAGEWRRIHSFCQPFDRIRLLVDNYIPMHAALFRRDLLELGCCFDETLDTYEDWDFWIQLSQHTDFIYVDQVTSVYRISGTGGFGVAGHNKLRALKSLESIIDKWRKIWPTEDVVAIVNYAKYKGMYENIETKLKSKDKELEEIYRLKESLLSELEIRDASLDNLSKNNEELNALLKQKENELTEVSKQLNEAENELDKTKNELAGSRQSVDKYNNVIKEYCSSSSWKITKPLRVSVSTLRKIRSNVSMMLKK